MSNEETKSPFEWTEDECSEVPVQAMVTTVKQQGTPAIPVPYMNAVTPYMQMAAQNTQLNMQQCRGVPVAYAQNGYPAPPVMGMQQGGMMVNGMLMPQGYPNGYPSQNMGMPMRPQYVTPMQPNVQQGAPVQPMIPQYAQQQSMRMPVNQAVSVQQQAHSLQRQSRQYQEARDSDVSASSGTLYKQRRQAVLERAETDFSEENEPKSGLKKLFEKFR